MKLTSIKAALASVVRHCHSACRTVALMTGGEAYAFFHTSIHGDFVTAYLVLSTWIKDALVRHHERKIHRDSLIARKTIKA